MGKEAYSFFPLVNNIIGYSGVITAAVGSMAGRFVTMRVYANDMEGANRYYTSVWVANFFLSIVFTIVSIFCVIYIDHILTVPSELLTEVQWLFGLGTFSLVLGLLTGVFGMPTYIKNRVDLSTSAGMVVNAIRIGLIVLLFWLFRPSIVYMSLSAMVAAIAGMFFNLRFKQMLLPELSINPKCYFDFSKIVELISSGIWNSVNQLSNMLLYQLDLLITNIFISASATGDYAIAKTAPALILNLLAMLSGTFGAHFNILYAKGKIDEVVKEVRKSMVIVGMIIGLPIGFLVIFSDCFYSLWVPGQNIELLHKMTVVTLLPMICGGSINPIFVIFSVTNKLRVPSMVLLGAGLIQVVIIFILLKSTSLGIWAIIIVSALQGGLRNALFSPAYGAISLGYKWYTFFPTMFRGMAGMMMVVGISFLYRQFFSIESWFDFFLAGAVVCSISLFVNSYVMMFKHERQYLLSVVIKKLHL